MTFKKMLSVLQELEARGHKGGYIYCSHGGEIGIQFNGQTDYATHLWLKKKGFVAMLPGGDYVYLPK